MGVIASNLVSAALLPPLNLVLLGAVGLLVRRKRPRIGMMLLVLALLLLLVFSTRAGSRLLIAPLEQRIAVPVPPLDAGARAIVVLGGGRIPEAPEYGDKDLPPPIVLARLRYAVKLHRQTGLPLLVSGGRPEWAEESEAEIMERALSEDYSVPVKWLEGGSRNTAENALFSARMLKRAGIKKILLVTDGIHMPRSLEIFEKSGLQVVPAPTALLSRGALHPLDFIPGGEGLRRSHYAMHEWIGLIWYRLRYRGGLTE